jgi:hypothetical protein
MFIVDVVLMLKHMTHAAASWVNAESASSLSLPCGFAAQLMYVSHAAHCCKATAVLSLMPLVPHSQSLYT